MRDEIVHVRDGEVRPWADVAKATPPALRLPRWLAATIGASVSAGPVVAWATRRRHRQGERTLRAIFFGAAFGYAVTSLVDFAEHFRLERAVTGRWLASRVVPLGETANHAATLATVVSAIALARPPARRSNLRDTWVRLAPAAFLALGWRDELVYHRRRSTHREDMMHTVPHLAAGVLWTALYAMRLVRW